MMQHDTDRGPGTGLPCDLGIKCIGTVPRRPLPVDGHGNFQYAVEPQGGRPCIAGQNTKPFRRT